VTEFPFLLLAHRTGSVEALGGNPRRDPAQLLICHLFLPSAGIHDPLARWRVGLVMWRAQRNC
jgi:hypothetical protein